MFPALFELGLELSKNESKNAHFAVANARYFIYAGKEGRLNARQTVSCHTRTDRGAGEADLEIDLPVPKEADELRYLAVSPWQEREGACLVIAQWETTISIIQLGTNGTNGVSRMLTDILCPSDPQMTIRSAAFPGDCLGKPWVFCGTTGGEILWIDWSVGRFIIVYSMEGSVIQLVFEDDRSTILASSTVRAVVLDASSISSRKAEANGVTGENLSMDVPLGTDTTAPIEAERFPLPAQAIGERPRKNTFHGVCRYRAAISLLPSSGTEGETLQNAVLAARPGRKIYIYNTSNGQLKTGKYDAGFPASWTTVRREAPNVSVGESTKEGNADELSIDPSAEFGLLYPLPAKLGSDDSGSFSADEYVVSISRSMFCIVDVAGLQVVAAFRLAETVQNWFYEANSGVLTRCTDDGRVELFTVAFSKADECLDSGGSPRLAVEQDACQAGGKPDIPEVPLIENVTLQPCAPSDSQPVETGNPVASAESTGPATSSSLIPSSSGPPVKHMQHLHTVSLSDIAPATQLSLDAPRVRAVMRPSVFPRVEFRASPLLHFLSSSLPTSESLEAKNLSVSDLSDALSDEDQAMILAGAAGNLLRNRVVASVLPSIRRLNPLSLSRSHVGENDLRRLFAQLRTLGYSVKNSLRQWAALTPHLHSLIERRDAVGDFLCKDVSEMCGALLVLYALVRLMEHDSYRGPGVSLSLVLEAGISGQQSFHDELIPPNMFWCIPPRHLAFLALLASRTTIKGKGRDLSVFGTLTGHLQGGEHTTGYFYPSQLLEAFRDTVCVCGESRAQMPFMNIVRGKLQKYWSGDASSGSFDLFKSLRIVGKEKGGEEELHGALNIVTQMFNLEGNTYYTFISIFLRDIIASVMELNLDGTMTGRLLRTIFCSPQGGTEDEVEIPAFLSLVIPAVFDAVRDSEKSGVDRGSFLSDVVGELFYNIDESEVSGRPGQRKEDAASFVSTAFPAKINVSQVPPPGKGIPPADAREFCLWIMLRRCKQSKSPPDLAMLSGLCSTIYSNLLISDYICGDDLALLLKRGSRAEADSAISAKREIQEILLSFLSNSDVLKFLIMQYIRVELFDEVVELISSGVSSFDSFLSIHDPAFYTKILETFLSLREVTRLLPRLFPLFTGISNELDSACLRAAIIKGLEIHSPKYMYSEVFLRFRQSFDPQDCKAVSVRLMVSSRAGESVC